MSFWHLLPEVTGTFPRLCYLGYMDTITPKQSRLLFALWQSYDAPLAAPSGEVREVMGDVCSAASVHGHVYDDWTHWELRYLRETGRQAVPISAYEAAIAGRYAR